MYMFQHGFFYLEIWILFFCSPLLIYFRQKKLFSPYSISSSAWTTMANIMEKWARTQSNAKILISKLSIRYQIIKKNKCNVLLETEFVSKVLFCNCAMWSFRSNVQYPVCGDNRYKMLMLRYVSASTFLSWTTIFCPIKTTLFSIFRTVNFMYENDTFYAYF